MGKDCAAAIGVATSRPEVKRPLRRPRCTRTDNVSSSVRDGHTNGWGGDRQGKAARGAGLITTVMGSRVRRK